MSSITTCLFHLMWNRHLVLSPHRGQPPPLPWPHSSPVFAGTRVLHRPFWSIFGLFLFLVPANHACSKRLCVPAWLFQKDRFWGMGLVVPFCLLEGCNPLNSWERELFGHSPSSFLHSTVPSRLPLWYSVGIICEMGRMLPFFRSPVSDTSLIVGG